MGSQSISPGGLPPQAPLKLLREPPAGTEGLFTPEAMSFVAALAECFAPPVEALLSRRQERQAAWNEGAIPDFPEETRAIRDSDWRIAEIPSDLLDRRVEITGPVDRKMIINGLNSGARVFMADFEDASTPTWFNLVHGQRNLRDAIQGTIDYTSPEGKHYSLNPETAVLIARVRGLHLPEDNVLFNGKRIPGALFDFGLYFYHNARSLLEQGTGPYFYIPKLEHYEEAALWREIFSFAEDEFGLERGTIKATLLIETLPAVFQMDEILHELKDHVVGLNCGRWDYIFSWVKVFHAHPDRVLPDRKQVTMDVPFLRAYSRLLIQICHRRGAFAMGGMAAQIPVRDDPDLNREAIEKVQADKEREASEGHDGTWVAHPGLVSVAREIFDRHLDGPNQLDRLREDVRVTRDDLLRQPEGEITRAGLNNNVAVSLQYLAAWLSGQGAVPINHLMEDAATAEIARSQLWQWIRHPAGVLEDGTPIDVPLVRRALEENLVALRTESGTPSAWRDKLDPAARLLEEITIREDFADFLTLEAYRQLEH